MRLPCVCALVLVGGCIPESPGDAPVGSVARALGCETSADCADDNPCNQDWCAYDDEAGGKYCRHSEYDTVAGCCYAPALDPATGLAWDPADQTTFGLPGTPPNGVPDAREAHGAAQCDDKMCSTLNGCDVQANECRYEMGVWSDCECDWPTQCDDGLGCTYDYCEDHKCMHYPKLLYEEPCCETDAQCAGLPVEEDECFVYKCAGGLCRKVWDIASYHCVNDAWCGEANADTNPCTAGKCILVDPATGCRRCQQVFMTDCKMELPYQESFDDAGSLAKVGWGIHDAGTPAEANWRLDLPGDLGSDRHLTFLWAPTTPGVASVAHSPMIDLSKADPTAPDGDFFNTLATSTWQWRMSYRHSFGGDPVTIRAVASEDDWVTWTVVNEWADLASDVEFSLHSFPLPGNLWKSPSIRIGFMVDTGEGGSTLGMDRLEIDDVRVAAGVPNRFLGVSNGALVESAVLPDVVLGACDSRVIHACFEDRDATPSTSGFFGRPAAWLEGSPLDSAPFVFSSGGCVPDAGALCGSGPGRFVCTLEVKPSCQVGFAGTYRIGIVVQDEWDPSKSQHSILQSLTRGRILVLAETGYLVWAPNGEEDPAAVALAEGIVDAGRPAQVVRDLALVPDLSKWYGVFAVLGTRGWGHVPTDAEAARLASYLDAGGRLYVEGGDFWAGTETALHPDFGVRVGQGGGSLAGPATGEGLLDGLSVTLAPGPLNDSNDLIAAAPGTGACEVLRVAPADPILAGALVVVRQAPAGPTAVRRTVASSFPWAGFAGGDRDEVLGKLVSYLENGWVQ